MNLKTERGWGWGWKYRNKVAPIAATTTNSDVNVFDFYNISANNINYLIYSKSMYTYQIINGLKESFGMLDLCKNIQKSTLIKSTKHDLQHILYYHPALFARAVNIIKPNPEQNKIQEYIEQYCPLPEIIGEKMLKTNFNRAIKNGSILGKILHILKDSDRKIADIFYKCSRIIALYIISLRPKFLEEKITRYSDESDATYYEKWYSNTPKTGTMRASPVNVIDGLSNHNNSQDISSRETTQSTIVKNEQIDIDILSSVTTFNDSNKIKKHKSLSLRNKTKPKAFKNKSLSLNVKNLKKQNYQETFNRTVRDVPIHKPKGTSYQTTSQSCTCKDHIYRTRECKHMKALNCNIPPSGESYTKDHLVTKSNSLSYLWKIQSSELKRQLQITEVTITDGTYLKLFRKIQRTPGLTKHKPTVDYYIDGFHDRVHKGVLGLYQKKDIKFHSFVRTLKDTIKTINSSLMMISSNLLPYVKDAYSAIIMSYQNNKSLHHTIYYTYIKNIVISNENDRILKSWFQCAGPLLLKILQKYSGNGDLDNHLRKLLTTTLEDNLPVHKLELDYILKNVSAFRELDVNLTPLSVASLGQVHLATYKTSKQKAILKFIKPKVLYLLSCEYKTLPESNLSTDVKNYISFMFNQTIEECNFKDEAFNIRKGHEVYGSVFKNIKTIEPYDYWIKDLPIITMSVAEGVSLNSVLKTHDETVCKKIVPVFKDLIYLWILKSLFTSPGYAHVDLHPGNIMVEISSLTLTLIDFGNFIHIPGKIQCPIIQIILVHNKIVSDVVAPISGKVKKMLKYIQQLCNVKTTQSTETSIIKFYESEDRQLIGSLFQTIIDSLDSVGDCAFGAVSEFAKGLQLFERCWTSLLRVAKMEYVSLLDVFSERFAGENKNKNKLKQVASKLDLWHKTNC